MTKSTGFQTEESNLRWVALARSKDPDRPNIGQVYRGKNGIMATDGHRIHVVEASPIEVPLYIDGRHAEFPDYEAIIPTTPPVAVIEAKCIFKNTMRNLAALSKLIEITGDRNRPVKLFSNNSKVYLSAESQFFKCVFKIEELSTSADFAICLNLNFFRQALAIGENLQIEFREALSVLVFKSGKRSAYVMPLRDLGPSFDDDGSAFFGELLSQLNKRLPR